METTEGSQASSAGFVLPTTGVNPGTLSLHSYDMDAWPNLSFARARPRWVLSAALVFIHLVAGVGPQLV